MYINKTCALSIWCTRTNLLSPMVHHKCYATRPTIESCLYFICRTGFDTASNGISWLEVYPSRPWALSHVIWTGSLLDNQSERSQTKRTSILAWRYAYRLIILLVLDVQTKAVLSDFLRLSCDYHSSLERQNIHIGVKQEFVANNSCSI